MTKDQQAVPLTRDYISDWELAHMTQAPYATSTAAE